MAGVRLRKRIEEQGGKTTEKRYIKVSCPLPPLSSISLQLLIVIIASYFDNHESINVVNDKARASQVQELADFVKKKTHGSPYPTIIAGMHSHPLLYPLDPPFVYTLVHLPRFARLF